MKRWLSTFSGAKYDKPTERIVRYAPKFGVDEVLVYDDKWLEEHPFRQVNRWIFEHPGMPLPGGGHAKRGYGWYSWKPLIILETFERMTTGDVVLFVDADTYPIHDLSVIYQTASDEGAMLFRAQWHAHARWCKADAFVVMGQDSETYRGESVQAGVARFMAFKKGGWKERQFLYEWLTYAVNPLANTFDPSVLGSEREIFEEHRAEQAIFTNLAHRYGYRLYREACDAGEGHPQDRDLYPQLFQQENCTVMGAPAEGSRWRNV